MGNGDRAAGRGARTANAMAGSGRWHGRFSAKVP
jgi:hypothetical protein